MKIYFLLLFFFACAHSPKIIPKYDRAHYKHWIDADKNCKNTRTEILQSRSLEPVTFKKSGCKLVKGKWNDYYYNDQLTKSSQVDLDHLIPLNMPMIMEPISGVLNSK